MSSGESTIARYQRQAREEKIARQQLRAEVIAREQLPAETPTSQIQKATLTTPTPAKLTTVDTEHPERAAKRVCQSLEAKQNNKDVSQDKFSLTYGAGGSQTRRHEDVDIIDQGSHTAGDISGRYQKDSALRNAVQEKETQPDQDLERDIQGHVADQSKDESLLSDKISGEKIAVTQPDIRDDLEYMFKREFEAQSATLKSKIDLEFLTRCAVIANSKRLKPTDAFTTTKFPGPQPAESITMLKARLFDAMFNPSEADMVDLTTIAQSIASTTATTDVLRTLTDKLSTASGWSTLDTIAFNTELQLPQELFDQETEPELQLTPDQQAHMIKVRDFTAVDEYYHRLLYSYSIRSFAANGQILLEDEIMKVLRHRKVLREEVQMSMAKHFPHLITSRR